MNIRDLKYLIAVNDLNSFSKAAERCFVSQPTLSGQLKKLEEELGASLMERSTRSILFTPLGEQVVEQARSIINTVEHIKALAQKTGDPMLGDFHIGLIPTVGPFLLPKIVPEINSHFPQMNLFLHELQTDVLITKLLKGELDAGILAKLDWDHAITEIPLYTEDLKLAVSKKDELAERNSVDLAVLKNRSVLMLEDGHCLRDQALGVCFAEGATEDKRFQATSMSTLLHMVAGGAGLTLIPELACDQKVAGLAYLSFQEPRPNRQIIMISRKKSARQEAIDNIAELISATVG